MSKSSYLLFYIVFALAIVVSPFVSGAPVLADTTEEITIGDVTDSGILPDSGFYFMKKWARSLQLVFTGSKAEKAKLMLKFSNENALALHKMYGMGKYVAGSEFAEQYALQLQNTIQTMEQVRTRQGENTSEELVNKLEQNYLRQQEVLLLVLEKAPEAAQNGLLNAIENSNKNVAAMVMAQKGELALQQYQEQVNQQTKNMGQETKIRVQQRLEVVHGQATQSSGSKPSEQSVTTQTQTQTQSQTQTQMQTQTQTQTQTQSQTQTQTQTMQQGGQHAMQQTGFQGTQNQGAGQANTNQGGATHGKK